MTSFSSQQLIVLDGIESLLKENSISYNSLSPYKEIASSIKSILEGEVEYLHSNSEMDDWIDFCKILIEETITNFHENIFWDFDYLIHSLILEYSQDKNRSEFLFIRKEKIKSIFRLFGSQSLIRFKYIHDFLYGFDWFKWQTQNREGNLDQQPFGMDFMNYIESRGHELIQLIEQNDTNYPYIDSDESRNPFYFSRCKEDEILLWKSLSIDDYIPVPAWKKEISLSLSKNFSELRNKRAQDLNITTNQAPGAHKI